MRKTAAALVVVCLAICPAVVLAQPDADSPFKVSVVRDRTNVVPNMQQTLRLTLRLDIPEKHKVYRNSISWAVPPDHLSSIQHFITPPGVEIDDPLVPAGKTVLTGEAILVLFLHVTASEPGRYTLRPRMSLQGCSDTICYREETRTLLLEVEKEGDRLRLLKTEVLGDADTSPEMRDPLWKLAGELTSESDFARSVETRGYVLALLAAFGSGFLVSLTPCVWPLIPIVLAVVGARAEGSGWKRGLLLSAAYVLGISLTYAVLGALAGLIGKGAQTLAQDPWLIGVVCLVFVALALSMFGLYDIRLPAGVAAKLSKRRGAGLAGVVATGVLSGLVASPCVSAPLLGLFAGVASLGKVWVGMLAGLLFAWGMGIILVAAGTSSKALQNLPGAGEWMVSVKRFFAWVMLGMAVWFSHMVVGTTVYRILMGVLLICGSVFLGALRSTRDETTWKTRVKQAAGILVLLVGLMHFASGAGPLLGLGPSSPTGAPSAGSGIQWVSSVDDGLARAQAEGKPAIIDFTADWCVYCHEMDREVFSRPAVVEESRRFVMIRADVTVHTGTVDGLYAKYGVAAPPAFVFVRRDAPHATVNRKLDLDTFLKLMRAVK